MHLRSDVAGSNRLQRIPWVVEIETQPVKVLKNMYFRQLENAEQLKQLLALSMQDTFHKVNPTNVHQTENNLGSLLGPEDTRETCFIS